MVKIPEWWIETTLGEVCDSITDTYSGNDENVYLVNTSDVLEWKLLVNETSKNENLKWQFKKTFKKDDILFSEIRPANRRYAFVNIENTENYIASTKLMVIRSNTTKIIPRFLYILITSDDFLNEMQMLAESRSWTFPQITFSWEISGKNILLPLLPEQKAIAGVLSSFDDKIELLRAENQTLEEMWQTLFKERFISPLAPWRGNWTEKNSSDPKKEKSPLGDLGAELPDGWKVGKLGEEFDISIWRTPPRAESEWFSTNSKDKKRISIKDMVNSWPYIFSTSEYLTEEAVNKFNIPRIPENTTILSFKMTVWKLAITTEEMLSNEAIAHLKIKNNSKLYSEFIYLYLQNLDFNTLWSTSSIVTAINSTIIKEMNFVIPDSDTLSKFSEIIKPIFKKIKINSKEIESLSNTRDQLLPKLMSWEVRVEF